MMTCSIPLLKYRETEGVKDQQNAIDKAKGIIAQPMPKSWHDHHAASTIEDPEKRKFYSRIVADKKPYFMRLVYPDLMRQYNTYIKNTNKNALREFRMTMDELLTIPEEKQTERQSEFIYYYHNRMPVGMGDCVMNKICRRFEEEFDGYLGRHNKEVSFDYTIMKSSAEYTTAQLTAIQRLYDEFNKRMKSYAIFASYERVDEYDSFFKMQEIQNEFLEQCVKVCPNRETLCNIVLDICYRKHTSKKFAWDMCGHEIIENLLANRGGVIKFPVRDEEGDIVYCRKRFSFVEKMLGEEENESDIE